MSFSGVGGIFPVLCSLNAYGSKQLRMQLRGREGGSLQGCRGPTDPCPSASALCLQLGRKPVVSCFEELILLEATTTKKWDCFSAGSAPRATTLPGAAQARKGRGTGVEGEQGGTERSILVLVGTDTSHQVPQAPARAVPLSWATCSPLLTPGHVPGFHSPQTLPHLSAPCVTRAEVNTPR